MCDIPLLEGCCLVGTVNRNMDPKEREALIKLGICDCFMQSTDFLWLSQMPPSTETACLLPELEGGLQGEPWKPVYEIGERITLSCPHGMHLEGARSILCEPSLKWSPDVKTVQCKRPGKPLQSSSTMQEFLSS